MGSRTSGDGSGQEGLDRSRRRFVIAILLPILITTFSQFEFVQQSTCVLAELPWGVGQCEVIADLLAPLWALTIIPLATLLRRWVRRTTTRPGSPTSNMGVLGTQRWVIGTTWAATAGAVLIIILSYTREWERFNEQPNIAWYTLVVVGTLVVLLIPLWWMRQEIHAHGVAYLEVGRLPTRLDSYLFSDDGAGPDRWPHIIAFAGVTVIVASTVLGQFNSLLLGMHLPEAPAAGIGSLAAIFEMDLAGKTDIVLERVAAWRDYTEAVGARFGSAYALVTMHVLIDALVMIPAYVAGAGTLLLLAWRKRHRLDESSQERRSYELINLVGVGLLAGIVVFDGFENLFTWYVMDRAWRGADLLTQANVRILWFLGFARFMLTAVLAVSAILLLAIGRSRLGRLASAAVAVRSELAVVGLLAAGLLVPPQMADVIRGWRVSHTVLTVLLVVVLSLLLRWTAANSLRLTTRLRQRVRAGESPEPRRVRIPLVGATPTISTLVGSGVVAAAAIQVVLTTGFGLPIGAGLVIPAGIVVAMWILGIPVPQARYVRGERAIGHGVRRSLPRLLGSAVYVLVGVAILSAAVGSVASARHEDWYLLFALVPIAIGAWRIHTRTTHLIGRLETGFAAAVALLGIGLLAVGDPELSPAALTFAGVTFAYGSLAFYNSYEHGSIVSVFSRKYLRRLPTKPFATLAAVILVGAVMALVLNPVGVAPRLGSIGVVLIGVIALALVGAVGVRLAELSAPPKILNAFGLKRSPILVMIVAWLILAPTLVPKASNDIRMLDSSDGGMPFGTVGFEDVYERWRTRNPDVTAGAATERPAVPMLFVSTSGGGIRAAVWTSYVLDCVFESTATAAGPCDGRLDQGDSRLSDRIVLLSGVSGGALGVASYLSYLLDPADSAQWVEDGLGDDYLAPALSWLMFVDIPRSLIGFRGDTANRSDIMEQAWERSWPAGGALDRGVGELWHAEVALPPFIMNGTSVNDACRFNASVLNVDGASPDVSGCADAGVVRRFGNGALAATYDLADLICADADVRLSTAVSMSARFPIVSSTARIAGDPEPPCRSRRSNAVYVVDGGYLEGSGAGTLLDAWEALSGFVEAHNASPDSGSCIVPFMLHIDNGYESPSSVTADVAPREFLVPLITLFNSQTGRITSAREEAAIAFEQPLTVAGEVVTIVGRSGRGTNAIESRYARLVTRAHPGVQAPLGWTLSGASIDDLRDQLQIAANTAELEQVRSWLTDDLVCETR